MPTVIATVGAADANSYVTVAEAGSYFSDSFGKGRWATASQATREALVITASRSLDQYLEWNGQKTDEAQSMEWPRKGTTGKSGIAYADDTIPMPVKFATYELAYYILENNGISFSDQTVDEVKVGSIEVVFSPRSTDVGIPNFIESLVSHIGTPQMASGNQVRMAKLVRT